MAQLCQSRRSRAGAERSLAQGLRLSLLSLASRRRDNRPDHFAAPTVFFFLAVTRLRGTDSLYQAGGMSNNNGIFKGPNILYAQVIPTALSDLDMATPLPDSVFYHAV